MQATIRDARLESKTNNNINIIFDINNEEFQKIEKEAIQSFIRLMQKAATPLFDLNGYNEIKKRMDDKTRLIVGEADDMGDYKICIFNEETGGITVLEAIKEEE